MSYKRSRATFEADLHAPYAIYGTPLPDEGERDDGSYLPLWKQEVRDEKGRRRLHGAFTGGWSAGYFNTVGSKEGWTPSTFVSSRNNRRKDEPGYKQQRAEDFMDDEDLADASEAQTLQTSQAFAGLGFSTRQELGDGGLMGIFRANGDTVGLKLLRKMGWKDGQGIGPKVRRSARLELGSGTTAADAETAETYLFAPEDSEMIQFDRKANRRGLGSLAESQRISSTRSGREKDDEEEEEGYEPRRHQASGVSLSSGGKAKSKVKQGSIGVGVLNDTGSDEEDPYEMGPKIKYNRVMGGDKKKRPKKVPAAANPSLKPPVFTLKRVAGAGNRLRRCHDGRLPLDGFVLAQVAEDPTAPLSRYAPPAVPQGWKSTKVLDGKGARPEYVSTADAAKASNHDSRSRAAVLGEKALPGKSVFDYISNSERDKIMLASGRKDLPPARGEIPEEAKVSDEELQISLWDRVPLLGKETAMAAIARGSRGPYADDESKRSRYRQYLEHHTGSGQSLPERRNDESSDDYLREMNEFYGCARIFKPMTGFMASRFTTAKTPMTISGNASNEPDAAAAADSKAADPAEEAAKMGLFGELTRTVEDFAPSRILCKRFNVKMPASARTGDEPEESRARANPSASAVGRIEDVVRIAGRPGAGVDQRREVARSQPGGTGNDTNEAIEYGAADADVLRAVFGDSDSDDE